MNTFKMSKKDEFALWQNQDALNQTILGEKVSRSIRDMQFYRGNNVRAAIVAARGGGKTHLTRLIQSKAIQGGNGDGSVEALFIRGKIFEYKSPAPTDIWASIMQLLLDANPQIHEEFERLRITDANTDYELFLESYFGEPGRHLTLLIDDFDWVCNYWARERCFEENITALCGKPWIDLVVSIDSTYFAEDSIKNKFESFFGCIFLEPWGLMNLWELMIRLARIFGSKEQLQMFNENRPEILGLLHLVDESPQCVVELYGLFSKRESIVDVGADLILELGQIKAEQFRVEAVKKLSPLETRIYYCFADLAVPVPTSMIASQLSLTKGTVRTLVARLHRCGLIKKDLLKARKMIYSVSSFLTRTGIQLYLHPEKYSETKKDVQGILDFFVTHSMDRTGRHSGWRSISTYIISRLEFSVNPSRDQQPTNRIKNSDNIALQSLQSNPFSNYRAKAIDEQIAVLGDSITQLAQGYFDQNELALLKGEYFETELECPELALMAYEESKLGSNDGNYLMRLFRLMLIARGLGYTYYHDQITRRFLEVLNVQGDKSMFIQLMWRVIKESRDKTAFLWACDYVYYNSDEDFGRALSEFIEVNQIDPWQLRFLVEYVATSSSIQAKNTLISLCEHRSSAVRASATRCLANFDGADSISAVKNLINDESPLVSANALYCLAKHDPNNALPILLDRLDTSDPNIQNFILKALGRMGEAKHLPEIERYLSSHIAEIRAAATEALAEIDSPRVLELLGENLTDPSSIVLQATAKALSRVSSTQALELLMVIANGPDTLSQVKALRELTKYDGRECIGLLIALCSHKDYLIRYHALEAVRYRENDLVLTTCIKLLSDPSALVRISAIRGIAHLDFNIDSLLPLLNDESWLVRFETCQFLGSFRNRTSVKLLATLFEDDHIEVRNAAAVAVAKIGGDEATISLSRILLDHEYDCDEIMWNLNPNSIQGLSKHIADGWQGRTIKWKAGVMQLLRRGKGDIHEEVINEGLHDLSPQVRMLALLVIVERKLRLEPFDIGSVLKTAELVVDALPERAAETFLQRLLTLIFQEGNIHDIDRSMIFASRIEEQYPQLIQFFRVAQNCLHNPNEPAILNGRPREVRHAVEYIISDNTPRSH
jgi:HEAT repeat protein/predicted transcriptional regulator